MGWRNMLNKVAIAISLIICLPHAAVTFAQERVRIGWAAMTASHTPLWVAQEKGLLAKQGLLVESIFFGAGPPAMQALVGASEHKRGAARFFLLRDDEVKQRGYAAVRQGKTD